MLKRFLNVIKWLWNLEESSRNHYYGLTPKELIRYNSNDNTLWGYIKEGWERAELSDYATEEE